MHRMEHEKLDAEIAATKNLLDQLLEKDKASGNKEASEKEEKEGSSEKEKGSENLEGLGKEETSATSQNPES